MSIFAINGLVLDSRDRLGWHGTLLGAAHCFKMELLLLSNKYIE